ncbi:Exosome component 10 [Dirofilaria immitis]|nr:Exosome component 10 [Dirofilaria immitis]
MSDQLLTNNPNDILNAVKNVKLCTIRAVAEANALPMRTEGYELYASFPVYANLMIEQQRRITTILRDVLQNAGCRIPVPAKISDLDEFLDRIVEANDSICERAGILLDLLQKAKYLEELVVPQQILDAESTAASGQTLSERQGRYAELLRRLPVYRDKILSSASAVPLLTPKEKPQVVFGIKVDNSVAEFKSKLKEKHHAMENSVRNLQFVDNDNDCTKSITWSSDEGMSLHPYYKELSRFKVPERQLTVGITESLKTLSDTELRYIDTVEELKTLRDTLNKEQEFSVDLEVSHNAQRSFLGLTCLMQISTRQTDYIIDPFPLWNDMHILNEPFTDPNILKVFHGADSDIAWLQRDFGIYVVNMFDTYKAMRVLNYSKFSYQHLVQVCCNHTLDKKFQKADWRLRPLTGAHKTYARCDTHYLLYCYDQLRKRLLDQEMLQKSPSPKFESDGYEKLLVGRKPLNSRQHFALAALWKWRDERARADDENPQYILPCHMMLQIAEVLPREMQGILACCSPVPLHVKQELHVLHQIINTSRDQPLVKLLCHLDFSSTKYNEEIRDIVTQEISKTIYEDDATTVSSDGLLATKLYTIGEEEEKKSERLKKVKEKLEDWATPYECYRIALIEQSSKANVEVAATQLQLESERRKNTETEMNIYEEMTLTKEELKKKENEEYSMKILQGTRGIDIPTIQDASKMYKDDRDIVRKRNRKSNWTNAMENCAQRVDYAAFNPEIFNRNTATVSDTCDLVKHWRQGKCKSRHGRMMQREPKR